MKKTKKKFGKYLNSWGELSQYLDSLDAKRVNVNNMISKFDIEFPVMKEDINSYLMSDRMYNVNGFSENTRIKVKKHLTGEVTLKEQLELDAKVLNTKVYYCYCAGDKYYPRRTEEDYETGPRPMPVDVEKYERIMFEFKELSEKILKEMEDYKNELLNRVC